MARTWRLLRTCLLHGIFALGGIVGCAGGPHEPAHEVLLLSDCNGAVRSARFRFPDTYFNRVCAVDAGTSVGPCTTTRGEAERIDGDLDVLAVRIAGKEQFGLRRYEISFARPEGDPAPSSIGSESIECAVSRDDESPAVDQTGRRRVCDFTSRGCFVELHVLRERTR